MVMGDVPFSNEVEIVRAELNFSDDVSKGGLFVVLPLLFAELNPLSPNSVQDQFSSYNYPYSVKR